MKFKYFTYYLLLTMFATTFNLNVLAQNVGINSIIVNFETDPTYANVSKTPLRFNKDIALSIHIENGDKDIISHAFPFLNGGNVEGTDFPGLTFTDGCDNLINFKMSSSIFSFNRDSLDVHDPANGLSSDFISWEEIINLYEAGWGIYNQGFVQASTKNPEYSIARNHSFVKYKTYNSVPGGIPMSVLINPKQDQTFNSFASAQNYRMAIKPDATTIHYQDVGSWPSGDFYELTRNSLDNGESLSGLVDELNNNTKSWASASISSITNRSPKGYAFDVFRFHMNYIETEYGSKGSDIIWVAPEEEVWDYRIVYDDISIEKELRGNKLLITFKGNIPTNLNHYALSLTVESDAKISSVEISGGGVNTYKIKQDTSALINLSWNGKTIVSDTVTAKHFVELAETNKTTGDALIATDYVNMLDSELPLKQELRDRICAINGVQLPEGYCSCEFTLGDDTTICYNDCIEIEAPADGINYLWSTNETSQIIDVCPTDTTIYYVTVNNKYDCSYTDTIQVNVEPEFFIQTSNDTTICPGNEITLYVSGGVSYIWSTGETTNSINVSPEEKTTYYIEALNANNCSSYDSIVVDIYSLPNADAGFDESICVGECVDLMASGGETYLWNTGEETNTINVCPDQDTTMYYVNVYDQMGCKSIDSVKVVLIQPPILSLSNDTSKCYADCIDIKASGALVYYWSTGESSSSIEVCPTTNTTYYVEGRNQFGCASQDSVKVSIKGLGSVKLDGLLPAYCVNENSVILEGTPPGGIYGGHGVTNNIFTPSAAGHGLHKIYYSVIDDFGCEAADTVQVIVYPIPEISLGNDTTLCLDQTLEIFNPAGYDSYYWSNGNVGNYINVSINNLNYGENILSLTVTDNGCANEDEVIITFESCNVGIEDLVEIGINLYPNPNLGIFKITYDGTEENIHFRIFNLQGQEVYAEELNDQKNKLSVKEVDVSFLKKGMYFIRFYSQKGIRTGKISIQ